MVRKKPVKFSVKLRAVLLKPSWSRLTEQLIYCPCIPYKNITLDQGIHFIENKVNNERMSMGSSNLEYIS